MKKTGRPSSWGGAPTKAVRVPEAIADQLLAIARRLQTESQGAGVFVQKPPTLLTVEDRQGARQYIIPPAQPLDPATEAEMDALIDGLFARHSRDDLLLILAGMAESTLEPI